MSNDITELHFKSLGAYGHIVLNECNVTCDTTSHMGRWKTTTPYSVIEPHSISLWQTPPVTVYCGVGLGFLTVILGFAAFGELRSNAWLPNLIFAVYVAICVTTFAFLIGVVRNWKAEWIMFPTTIDGHRIAYMRTRRNKRVFDTFTTALTSRIAAATNRQDLGEPTVATESASRHF